MEKKVKSTSDYEMFKKLKGNRDVEPSRVNKIKESILNVGYITSPIIVNEKYEVIDGQGRLQALKELELPVEYIIHKGIGITECISMNVHQTNWSMRDYIKSYAERGIQSYCLVEKLMQQYPRFGINVFATACLGVGGFNGPTLKAGSLDLTEEDYENGIEKLEYLKKLLPYFDKIKDFGTLAQGITYCLYNEEIDKDKLFTKVSNAIVGQYIKPWSSLAELMQSLEELYNKNSRSPFVYIYTDYRKFLDSMINKRKKNQHTSTNYLKETYLDDVALEENIDE